MGYHGYVLMIQLRDAKFQKICIQMSGRACRAYKVTRENQKHNHKACYALYRERR